MKFTKKLIGKKLVPFNAPQFKYVVPIEQFFKEEYWCLHRCYDNSSSVNKWEIMVVPMNEENWNFYEG